MFQIIVNSEYNTMKHELLSPAGNIEAGYAALYYGADAVYLGLTKFSARAGAENFTAEELDTFTAYAHSLKRKVYVALNTILSEDEINDLPEMIQTLKKTNVDGLIIQDLGVYYLVKKYAPEIELHASTQMAVHNLEGAKFLKSLGFKRVVLARELTLNEIKKIASSLPDLDLEVFIHGALCYSYSGQCLFSALEYGKSANRGRCVYPCRAFYKEEGENVTDHLCGHLFSMKDLALEEKVLDIPALSLKIEGRKKSPLYVAAVTNYYRHILDGNKKNITEAEDIKQIFSRPWCQFHFNGKNKDITDEQFVGHRGLLIGKVEKISKNKLCFTPLREIARYDGLQIDSGKDEKPYGFGIKNMYVNQKSVFKADAGTYVEIELPDDHPHLAYDAPVYLASSTAVKGKYDYKKPKPNEYRNYTAFEVTVEISADTIWALSEDKAVSVHGDFQPAKNPLKTREAVETAFMKTNDTEIKFKDIELKNPDGRFAPASLLNELRRKLVAELSADLSQNETKLTLPELKAVQLKKTDEIQINILDVPLHSLVEDFDEKDIQSAWFRLPQICRNIAKLHEVVKALYDAGARQFVAENYYAFELLKGFNDIKIGAGSFLYVMNRYAAVTLKEIGASWATIALESAPENMEQLVKTTPLPLAQITDDFPPLFTSAVCIRRNDCKHCDQKAKRWELKADGRKYTAVLKDCQLQLFSEKPYHREKIAGTLAVKNVSLS